MSAVLEIAPLENAAAEIAPLTDYVAVPDGDRHEVVDGPVFKVPQTADWFAMRCTRANMPIDPTYCLKLRALLSFDGGQTWQFLAAIRIGGGDAYDKGGVLSPHSWINTPMPVVGRDRLVRIEIIPVKDVSTMIECIFINSKTQAPA